MAGSFRSLRIIRVSGQVKTNTGTRTLVAPGDSIKTGPDGRAYLDIGNQGKAWLFNYSNIILRDFSETDQGCYRGRLSLSRGNARFIIPHYNCRGSRLWVELADGSVLRFIGTEVQAELDKPVPTVGTKFGVVALEQPAMPPIDISAGQYSRRVNGQWQAAQKAPPLTITVEQRRGGVVVLTHPDNSVCVGANCRLGALLLPPLPQIVVVEGPTGTKARWLVRWP